MRALVLRVRGTVKGNIIFNFNEAIVYHTVHLSLATSCYSVIIFLPPRRMGKAHRKTYKE